MGKSYVYLLISLTTLMMVSCHDEDLYDQTTYSVYQYPSTDEVSNAVAEITIVLNDSASYKLDDIAIPPLKYNKSWLFMLTQDDCKQSAFCRTWAAINGKPISSSDNIDVGHDTWKALYYNVEQLVGDDLPENVYWLGKTLGSTDGAGNEMRFNFTTTIAPEETWMDNTSLVRNGYTKSLSRFYMSSGLNWNDVATMLNYGIGIAFHNVKATTEQNVDSIAKHFVIAQDTTIEKLSGRGMKMLARPDGNNNYIVAAKDFEDIQTMVAESGTTKLYPFAMNSDLNKVILDRFFVETGTPLETIEPIIEAQLDLPKEQRMAVHVGVHNTDNNWVSFLYWLNNTYGKDGDDSVWFPSQEEYYEYNYYRTHAEISKTVTGDSIKISIKMPSGRYFYYPALTLNIPIAQQNIRSIVVNDVVTGLSYNSYNDGMMVNIDCRKHLADLATYYVEQYEASPSDSDLADALYFTNQLKDSSTKTDLLQRLGK